MPSYEEALRALETRLFVGRERELATFTRWLSAPAEAPEILNVTGPGGAGKSTLLRAFRRIAETIERPIVLVDGRDLRATPEGLLNALSANLGLQSAPNLETVVAALNERRPLLLLDTFELLIDLTGYLRDALLPPLDASVRVVIAGRHPLGLAWSRDNVWQRLVRPLPLGGLAPEAGRAYLARRGLASGPTTAQILGATGGHPLALALAADLVLQQGVRQFAAAPEWRLAVSELVERLLEGLDDPRLRVLLEVGAVLRQFDESTLLALGGPEATGAFDRLARLSMVRPARDGLMLHDDVRRILADELRWRNPERYRELRLGALRHYHERMASAHGEERERLLAEQFFLWEDAFVRGLLFADSEPGQIWLEPGRPADHADVLRIESFWFDHFLAAEMRLTFDREQARAFTTALLQYHETRLRIARDPDGRALGFNLGVPVCLESRPMLETFPARGQFVDIYLDVAHQASLPATAAETPLFWLVQVAHMDIQPEAVRAALARDIFSVLAGGGIYLANSPIPSYKQLLETMGFQRLPAARNWLVSDQSPMDSYVLDLRQIGVKRWIESLIRGTTLAPVPGASTRQTTALAAAGPAKATDPLTPRERDVVVLIARGLSNRQIAETLVIAEGTAERHVANILSKLDFSSRAQVAAWAVKRGLTAAVESA